MYSPYKVGGAEISTQNLAEALAILGNDVYVITLHNDKSIKSEVKNNVKVIRVPIRNIYWPFDGRRRSFFFRLIWHIVDLYNPFARSTVTSVLKNIEPDIVHTNNLSGFSISAWDAALNLKIPVAHTSRDYYLIHPNNNLYANNKPLNPNNKLVRLFNFLKRIKSNNIDYFIPISHYISRLHISLGYFKSCNSKVIYNSISLQKCLMSPARSDGPIKLGYLGRLEERKGIEDLMAAVNKSALNYELFIAGVGDDEYLEKLKQLKCKAKINWLGHVPQETLFHMIDILAVPSKWPEPLGRVVLESYSHGVPVIASDSGGIPEIVEENKTGLIFNSSKLESLVFALNNAILLLDNDVKINCLNYAAEFSSDRVAKKFLVAFSEIMFKKSANPSTVTRE